MIKKKTIVRILVFISITWFVVYNYLHWNDLGNKFFVVLFDDTNYSADNICRDDNLADINTGLRYESYQLSEKTFKTFVQRFTQSDSVDFPHFTNTLYNNNSVLTWRKTPVIAKDIIILDISNERGPINDCFKLEQIKKLTNSKGNYYAAYYDKEDIRPNSHVYDGRHYWFILDGKSRILYLISTQT